MFRLFGIGLTMILLMSSAHSAMACSCDWGGNFIKAAAKRDVIFKGKVIKRTYHASNGKAYNRVEEIVKAESALESNQSIDYYESITIEIQQMIKGKETSKTVRIVSSDGADCFIYTRHFKVGAEYIFSTDQRLRNVPDSSIESSPSYQIWACSENWLAYNAQTNEVTGEIIGKSHKRKKISWSYDRLLEKLK